MISQSESEQITEKKSKEKISEKPLFVCDICGKSFDSENSLKAHQLRVHKIRAVWKSSKEGGEEIYLPKTEKEEIAALKTEVQKLKLEKERLLRELELAEAERSYYTKRYGFDPYSLERAAKQSQMLLNDPLVRLEYLQLLRTYRKRLESEAESNTPTNLAPTPQIGVVSMENEEIKALREEIKELKAKLEEEKEKRREEQLKKLEEAINELQLNTTKVANQFSVLEVGIKELTSLAKEYLALGKVVLEKRQEKSPVREKIGEESIIYDLLPSELVIEEKE